MSDTLKLGQIIEPGRAAERDAIHVAVAPVIAGQNLRPRDKLMFAKGQENTVMGAAPHQKSFGIVDPFLEGFVRKGDRFWAWLTPGTITSLRHDWTHPEFGTELPAPVAPEPVNSEKWLREFAETAGMSYKLLLERGHSFIAYDDVWTEQDGETARDAIYDVGAANFWKHYEAVTGQRPDDIEDAPFSCSC